MNERHGGYVDEADDEVLQEADLGGVVLLDVLLGLSREHRLGLVDQRELLLDDLSESLLDVLLHGVVQVVEQEDLGQQEEGLVLPIREVLEGEEARSGEGLTNIRESLLPHRT